MLGVCWLFMSKMFFGLIAAVTGVFAVGTVVAQENAKRDPISQQFTAMNLQLTELNARVDSLVMRRENHAQEGIG